MDAPVLGEKESKVLKAHYEPNHLSKDCSPFNSEIPCSGIPPTYIQVAGMDIMRDDGLVYARALKDSGVDVRLDVYPGMLHGHYVIWPQLKQSFKSQIDTLSGVGWLLGIRLEREVIERFWTATD
ncbi:hypothetical protein BGW36DRAFT_389313, partial [Talaromyces proteolyticus]